MPRMTSIGEALERARRSVARGALKRAIAGLPRGTELGDLMKSIGEAGAESQLGSLTLGDLAEALGGGAAVQAPAGSAKPAATGKRRGRRPGSTSTKTAATRGARDEAIAAYLSSAGTAKAEDIRAAVGGTPTQLRKSLTRLMGAGSVKRTGERRGTQYHWRGGSAAQGGGEEAEATPAPQRRRKGGRRRKAGAKG